MISLNVVEIDPGQKNSNMLDRLVHLKVSFKFQAGTKIQYTELGHVWSPLIFKNFQDISIFMLDSFAVTHFVAPKSANLCRIPSK